MCRFGNKAALLTPLCNGRQLAARGYAQLKLDERRQSACISKLRTSIIVSLQSNSSMPSSLDARNGARTHFWYLDVSRDRGPSLAGRWTLDAGLKGAGRWSLLARDAGSLDPVARVPPFFAALRTCRILRRLCAAFLKKGPRGPFFDGRRAHRTP